MWWHASIAPQRLTPRGEVVMARAERLGLLTGGEYNYVLGRWRS